jgi:hypothetical protein
VVPTTERANELLSVASGMGYGNRDIAAFVPVLRELAGQNTAAA